MTDEGLKLFLPAFLIVFLLITFFWSKISKRDNIISKAKLDEVHILKLLIYKRVFSYYKIILLFFSFIIFVFCYFPTYYNNWFIPIERLNTTLINGIGFHMLKILLIWLIVVEIFLDRSFKRNQDSNRYQKVIISAYDKLLIGLLFVFICYTLTITNVFSLVLISTSILLYIYLKIKILLD